MPFDIVKSGNKCDCCGAPNAMLRTFTEPDWSIIYWLSGCSCQKCIDTGKVDEYVRKMQKAKLKDDKEYEKLLKKQKKLCTGTSSNPDSEAVKNIENRLEELRKNQQDRDKLAERSKRMIQDEKERFTSIYGPGVNQECSICGQKVCYLNIFEDHKDQVEILDELSFWSCADCVLNGRKNIHLEKVLRDFTLFNIECNEARNKYESLGSLIGLGLYLEEGEKKSHSTIKRYAELGEQEAMYKRNAERMKAERIAYEGIPIKTIIKTGAEGNICFFCGKPFDKDNKCGCAAKGEYVKK